MYHCGGRNWLGSILLRTRTFYYFMCVWYIYKHLDLMHLVTHFMTLHNNQYVCVWYIYRLGFDAFSNTFYDFTWQSVCVCMIYIYINRLGFYDFTRQSVLKQLLSPITRLQRRQTTTLDDGDGRPFSFCVSIACSVYLHVLPSWELPPFPFYWHTSRVHWNQ